MRPSTDYAKRLEALAAKLNASTEYSKYAFLLLAAAEELKLREAWQNCSRCGAAILNQHPEATPSLATRRSAA